MEKSLLLPPSDFVHVRLFGIEKEGPFESLARKTMNGSFPKKTWLRSCAIVNDGHMGKMRLDAYATI